MWEYLTLSQDIEKFKPLSDSALNKVGQEGWELISIVAINRFASNLIYTFKRYKSPNPELPTEP